MSTVSPAIPDSAAPASLPPAPLVLDTQGGGLIFLQIVEHYRQQILRGVYRKGEKLPTCREIAAPLGISPQTVNRALDQLAREGLLVRRRALGSIVSWGEEGQPVARRTVQPPSPPPMPPSSSELPVGLVVKISALPAGEGDLFMDYLNGIMEGFAPFGKRLEIVKIKPDQPDVAVVEPLVRRRRVCGLIVLHLQASAVDFLVREQFPAVSINTDLTGQGVTSVVGDDLHGYQQAWEYAGQLGHREAVFIAASRSMISERRTRVCAAAREVVRPQCHLHEALYAPPGSTDELWAQLEATWGPWHPDPKRRRWPTLFFTGADVFASRLLQTFAERGIRVPEQVSVIGYSDSVIASHLSPALTTLSKPRKAMAVAAAELLIDILAQRPSSKGAMQVFPVELNRRASCAPPAAPSLL